MASPTAEKHNLDDEEKSAIPEKVIRFEDCVKSEEEPTAISKSGRVRKKSAKVLEMEEAEEMERIVARMPKASVKAAKKVKKEPGMPAASPSTIKNLLSANPSKTVVHRENSLEALQAQLSKGGFLLDPPSTTPPPSSKKAKPKKPAAAGGIPLDGQFLETEVRDETGTKLKLLLTQPPCEPILEAASLPMAEPGMSQSDTNLFVVETIPKTPKKKRVRKDSDKLATCEFPEDTATGALKLEDMALFQDSEADEPSLDLSTESGSELDMPLVIDTVGTDCKSKKKGKKDRKSKVKLEASSPPVASDPLNSPGSEQEMEDVEMAIGEVAGGDLPVYANTQAMGMKLMTSAEKKANKKKPKKTKKEEELEKQPKKKRAPTAYMMWCNIFRPKVVAENPGIDFAAISRRLGEIWQALPDKEKMSWKMKAKRAANKAASATKGSTLISTGKAVPKPPAGPGLKAVGTLPATAAETSEPVASASGTQIAVRTATENPDVYMYKVVGTSPVDAAAHLKLLGESLSIIGARLQEHQGQIAVQGSLSVLLDSLLCALGPLVCLTNQLPELDGCAPETHSSTLDNIAYFMPGIG